MSLNFLNPFVLVFQNIVFSWNSLTIRSILRIAITITILN